MEVNAATGDKSFRRMLWRQDVNSGKRVFRFNGLQISRAADRRADFRIFLVGWICGLGDMPLYKVKIESTVVVYSDEKSDAEMTAKLHTSDMDQTEFAAYLDGEIRTLDELPPDWDGECVPYGHDGNTRLKDLVT